MSVMSQAFDANDRQRYDQLVAKRQDETLTPEEYDGLIRLSDCYELYDAARIAALIELAEKRGVTLDELMVSPDATTDTGT